jgi:hypothetical protein
LVSAIFPEQPALVAPDSCMKSLHLFVGGAILSGAVLAGFGQGTAFLYQGQLTSNGAPANGSYDLTFALCNAGGPAGNTLTNAATAVSNGLFSVALDFGPGVFNGSNLWLQIGVRPNGGGDFTPLSPRQPILAAPYAVMAGTAANLSGPLPAAQLSGAYPGNVAFDNAANSFAGLFAGDGSGLTNVDAASLNGWAASNFATLDALTNYATLDVLTNYASVNVLTNYATVASLTNTPAASAIPNLQVFDSPGTSNFTIPAGVTQIAVEVWGGGGGGGNAGAGAGSSAAAGGGGAGGYGKGVFTVMPGSNYTVIVGAGGANAVAGGATSFGALISAGGGSAGPNAPTSHGGAGGTSSAPINILGGAGQWTSSEGGNGGGGAGNGGSGGPGDALIGPSYVGGSGQVPGGGGGGGYDGGDQGGPGGHGRVVIYY